MALLERSRINDFSFWRGLEGRIIDMRWRRPIVAAQPAPAPVPVEERRAVEPVQ
jgi:hypothetical protein